MSSVPPGVSVEQWNDELAREHDIDAYYASSNRLVRMIEGMRLRAIRSLLAPIPGERILEVGCGGGHVLERFPECSLVGVDVSGAMLEKARTRLEGLDVEFHKGELGDVGLPAEGFDGVICSEVLEHVVDPDVVLAAVVELLEPDGRGVITFPNDPLITRGKAILKKSGVGRLPQFKGIDWGGDRYHLHHWTVPEMKALLARHFDVASERHVPSRLAPVRCCFLVRRARH